MADYRIEVTAEAQADLSYYTAFERKIITVGIRDQLTHQPLVETRSLKKLRDNPVASWEMRAGKYRVFYEVDEGSRQVTIVAVGNKEHNILFVRGERVNLCEQ
jgi:mRNA-degrading endonuclease RelE of RelBE toxin-antitoxin system